LGEALPHPHTKLSVGVFPFIFAASPIPHYQKPAAPLVAFAGFFMPHHEASTIQKRSFCAVPSIGLTIITMLNIQFIAGGRGSIPNGIHVENAKDVL
jgi:hypothetical protein